ncbi:MAG: endonuclease/exonuclease/phosphatase family protein [Acidimicrobiales bacterium]
MLKVVTWNIRHGYDIEQAIDELETNVRLRGADALFLQEMDREGTAAVAEALRLHHAYAAAGVHYRTDRDFGNAVLSPWPLVDREVIELPHKAVIRGQHRLAVKAIARIGNSEITLCTTHTEIPSLGRRKRDDQVAALCRAADQWPTELAVIGGDFNTISARGVRSLATRFKTHGFDHVSTDAISTLRRVGRNFTLDHVFARGLQSIESGVARGVNTSDHDPVWVELIGPEST